LGALSEDQGADGGVQVDSFRFLPRSFRPLYEGRGPFPGEEDPVWAPFGKRLAESRIALLTSAGLYLKATQESFDLESEQSRPEWGDPTWRRIPAATEPSELAVAHLHINDEDLRADPEIVLPARLLGRLATEGVVGSAAIDHVSVMGFQERSLEGWREKTVPELIVHLRNQNADGLILAPA
jgi:D-proline reductase (dithiol) PrdB